METAKTLSAWAIPAVVVFALLAVGIAVWRGLFGYNRPVGRDIAVRPGMYNLREEMQKPADSYRQKLRDNPPSTDVAKR